MLGANRSSRAKRFGDANFEALSSNLERPNAVAMQIRPMRRGEPGVAHKKIRRVAPGAWERKDLCCSLSAPRRRSRSFESGGFFEVVSAECAYRRSSVATSKKP